MKSAAAWLVLAAAPAWAQVAKPVAASSLKLSPTLGPRITPQTFTELERRFDSTLYGLNPKDPLDLLGTSRALYLRDYGLVLTAEVSLVATPPTIFRKEIGKEETARIHQRKLAQLPALKHAMREMIKVSALTLSGAVGVPQYETSSLQVVLAVKLLYLSWEDTDGLPGQILMQASLKDAIAGEIREEQQ